MFSWKDLKKPIIALSPMADMTDSAFCRIAKRFGAPIMFREMISAEGLVHGSEKSLAMAEFHQDERPIIQQLFGSKPESMATAVKIIDEAWGPDGFDINMGCPVYKITSNFNGAALMREPETATAIINAIKAATAKPVSVKLRLGWSDPTEVLEFIRVIEMAGADLVTIHGRTKEQGYGGVADWEMIGRAKQRTNLPVLCNGDIFTLEAAVKALQVSGCDGVLIARGALGNPWIFGRIEAALHGSDSSRHSAKGQSLDANQSIGKQPSLDERIAVVRDHAGLHVGLYGGTNSLVTFRKHLSWYFKGVPGVKPVKERLMRVSTLEELDDVMAEIKKSN